MFVHRHTVFTHPGSRFLPSGFSSSLTRSQRLDFLKRIERMEEKENGGRLAGRREGKAEGKAKYAAEQMAVEGGAGSGQIPRGRTLCRIPRYTLAKVFGGEFPAFLNCPLGTIYGCSVGFVVCREGKLRGVPFYLSVMVLSRDETKRKRERERERGRGIFV